MQRSVPENTRRANVFALRVYEEWVAARNMTFDECQYPDLSSLPNVGTDLLIQVLSHFVYEIRRKDGKEYPPSSIYGIMCGVMRYLRDDCNRPDLNFFNQSNKEFHYLRRCIDSRMQELTSKGVGSELTLLLLMTKKNYGAQMYFLRKPVEGCCLPSTFTPAKCLVFVLVTSTEA